MALELLKNIQSAEESAEARRADAQREGREILKSTEEACTAAERVASAELRAQYQRLLEKRQGEVRRTIEGAAGDKAAAREALCRQAEGNLDKAATYIFERVVNDGHR